MIERGRIFRLWLPLALSWLMMGAELPLVVAAVSRLPDAEVQLAALGSVVHPVSLLVEAPIIMLLAASIVLARDRASHAWLTRLTWVAGGALSAVHALIAFTPLYDALAAHVLEVPPAAREPARIGLMLMTPWSLAIAYRRFQQGAMIRFEHSRAVSYGTLVRLAANGAVLVAGVLHGGFSGAAVGSAAIAVGVTAEAVYAGFAVRPVLRARLPARDEGAEPLRLGSFLRFYLPLAFTPFLTLAMQPIGAAAMNRMPDALHSVAAWPAVYGLIFLLRSCGFAFQEVAVRLAGEPGGRPALRAFAVRLAVLTSLALLALGATPLGRLWFGTLSGLPPALVESASFGLLLGVLLPANAAWINYLQGVLVQARRTRSVTAAVVVYVAVACAGLGIGVTTGAWRGLYAALVSLTAGGLAQIAWLAVAAARLSRGGRPGT